MMQLCASVCVPSPLAACVVLHSLCMWLDKSDVMGGGGSAVGKQQSCRVVCGIIGHSHTIPRCWRCLTAALAFWPGHCSAHDCGVHVLTRTSCAVQYFVVQQRARLQHTWAPARGVAVSNHAHAPTG